MELNELIEAHDVLVARARNMRADMSAQGLLLDAIVLAMPPRAREALQHNFEQLSERFMSSALANSADPTDQAIAAAEAAMSRIRARLQTLPRD